MRRTARRVKYGKLRPLGLRPWLWWLWFQATKPVRYLAIERGHRKYHRVIGWLTDGIPCAECGAWNCRECDSMQTLCHECCEKKADGPPSGGGW